MAEWLKEMNSILDADERTGFVVVGEQVQVVLSIPDTWEGALMSDSAFEETTMMCLSR